MTKSRLQTEQKILNALEKILLEQGFPAVGINSIARQAGCDKVLIYRYFDGLDGLLLAYAETTPLWWEVDEIIVETTEMIGQQPLHLYLQELLKRHVLALQSRPISLEIIPNDPALLEQIKFQPIPTEKIGLQKNRWRQQLPQRIC